MSRRASKKLSTDVGAPYGLDDEAQSVEDWDEGAGTSVYETDLSELEKAYDLAKEEAAAPPTRPSDDDMALKNAKESQKKKDKDKERDKESSPKDSRRERRSKERKESKGKAKEAKPSERKDAESSSNHSDNAEVNHSDNGNGNGNGKSERKDETVAEEEIRATNKIVFATDSAPNPSRLLRVLLSVLVLDFRESQFKPALPDFPRTVCHSEVAKLYSRLFWTLL